MKRYIAFCKEHNLQCSYINFEKSIIEKNWKHANILDCIKTSNVYLRIDNIDENQKKLLTSTLSIWQPQLEDHSNTILSLIKNNFVEE